MKSPNRMSRQVHRHVCYSWGTAMMIANRLTTVTGVRHDVRQEYDAQWQSRVYVVSEAAHIDSARVAA